MADEGEGWGQTRGGKGRQVLYLGGWRWEGQEGEAGSRLILL